jgi:hypothetical protein
LQLLRYKYLPLDGSFKPPFDEKGSLSVIRDGTIKFTHPNEFNDPFDCHPEIDFNNCFSEKSLKKFGQEMGWSPARRIREKPKLIKLLKANYKFFLDGINNSIAICCLSKNPCSLLMWSHYATSHTGFVVEFSIPELQPRANLDYLIPFPVEYKNNKPKVDNSKSKLQEYVLTKGIDWKYEEEQRVIDFDRKAGIHAYDRKQILKSVIAGMRMTDDDFTTLRNTVAAVNEELGISVTVHRAQPSPGKFAIFVPGKFDAP